MFYNFRKNKKAFTLVELIVVVAIIAVLGTVVGIAVGSALKKSKETAAETNAKALADQVKLFFAGDEGSTADQKLSAYITEKLPGLKGTITYNSNFGDKKVGDTFTSGTIDYTENKITYTITVKNNGETATVAKKS